VTLLARNAEQLFWLARYIERAASLARIIEIHAAHGGGAEDAASWAWLVALYSDEERFRATYAEPTFKNVITFYVGDIDNPGSIRSAIRCARENARALRAVIPTEMWVQLNEFHNKLIGIDETEFDFIHVSRTCGVIKRGCYAHLGVVESALYRDEGERFYRLGLMIERADQTSRLLDVKFAQLETRNAGSHMISDTTFWALVLRSAAAYQSFRRLEQSGADPSRVARFLLVNASQPRSVAFCAGEIHRALQDLRSGYKLRQTNRSLEQVEILFETLSKAAADRDLVSRLHWVNDWIQGHLIALSSEIATSFFGHEPPEASELKPSQTQSQSQSGVGVGTQS
jgi:uncharacterized alpha-E superfamily protein